MRPVKNGRTRADLPPYTTNEHYGLSSVAVRDHDDALESYNRVGGGFLPGGSDPGLRTNDAGSLHQSSRLPTGEREFQSEGPRSIAKSGDPKRIALFSGPSVFIQDRASLFRTERPDTGQSVPIEDTVYLFRTECTLSRTESPPQGPSGLLQDRTHRPRTAMTALGSYSSSR